MENFPVIILGSVLFSAFFAGMEIAFISANKLLIELKNKQGSLYAKILSPFVSNPSRFISTTLVGNNIGLVVYGIYMARVLDPLLVSWWPGFETSKLLLLLTQTLISTVIVLVTAEFIPKVLFRINPDSLLKALAVPFLLFYYLFWPIVHFINWLAHLILNRLLKMEFSESTPAFSKLDLDEYISQVNEDDLNEDAEVDTEMFKNALDFSEVQVRDCMTPRTELVSINLDASIDELYQKFKETGLSKILVYEKDPDQIIGYVHQKEMFKKPLSLRNLVIPIEIATETMAVMDLLNKFSKSRKSLALVVDELGGTAGIVTIEDIMEEVFGEIEDEHDVEELTEETIAENQFRLNARLEVNYLNEKYSLEIPEGDYSTLGGFILAYHESLPQAGEVIEIAPFTFLIESVSNARINVLLLTVNRAQN
ncbi:MAG: hemolysin family protein [Bacteroidetes bacterium]|nr:hemolysin family protein [Bacteroidota bacterium]